MSDHQKKPRIKKEKRNECLAFFKDGYGYKKTASLTGLNAYTVREYLRRYKAGDISWSERGSKSDSPKK